MEIIQLWTFWTFFWTFYLNHLSPLWGYFWTSGQLTIEIGPENLNSAELVCSKDNKENTKRKRGNMKTF